MNYSELIGLINVEFRGLIEPEINSLTLLFDRCAVSKTPEDLIIGEKVIKDTFPVYVDVNLPILQVDFKSYIAYSVTNESYTTWDDYEVFEGKAFRIYSKSRYLDFIRTHTFADENYPGPFVHYGVVCLNHILNIVSTTPPIIKEIDR